MFRRMARADFNAPCKTVNDNFIILFDALIGLRQRVNMLAEPAKSRAITLQSVLVKTGSAIKANALIGHVFAGIGGHSTAHQIIGTRHMEIGIKAFDQPTGQPDMVGMHMGDNHLMDRLAAHKAVKQLFPMGARAVHINTCIDNHPAIAIAQQPDIDVVQRIGQIHTRPKNAISHLNRRTDFRLFVKWIAQAVRLRARFCLFCHNILNAFTRLGMNPITC